MTNSLQPVPLAQTSMWRRLLALMALLAVLVGSGAQAAHRHGDWLPHQRSQVAATSATDLLDGGEAGCPLCVAMHSAFPSQVLQCAVLFALCAFLPLLATPSAVAMVWHFVLFSRPPPLPILTARS